jgi:hypothetical protein
MGMNVLDGNRTPVGFERDTDLSTVFTCTVPTNARVAIIQAVDNDLNWRDDGTNAAVTSGTGGMLLAAGDSFLYTGKLEAFTAIEAVAAATAGINITYYK